MFQLVWPSVVRLTHLSAVFPVTTRNAVLVARETVDYLVRQDSTCSPADLWRKAVHRGHGARTTLLPSPAAQNY